MMRYYRVQAASRAHKVEAEVTVGESIEKMLRRIKANKGSIGADAPPIFTERKDGVLAQTDIRNDKFDTALDALDKNAELTRKRRSEMVIKKLEKDNPPKLEGGDLGGEAKK